jgi:hypothetical protein
MSHRPRNRSALPTAPITSRRQGHSREADQENNEGTIVRMSVYVKALRPVSCSPITKVWTSSVPS